MGSEEQSTDLYFWDKILKCKNPKYLHYELLETIA